MNQKDTKGITVRPAIADTEAYVDVCRKIGVPPSVVLRTVVEEVARTGIIPLQFIPEKYVARMRESLDVMDTIKSILEAEKK